MTRSKGWCQPTRGGWLLPAARGEAKGSHSARPVWRRGGRAGLGTTHRGWGCQDQAPPRGLWQSVGMGAECSGSIGGKSQAGGCKRKLLVVSGVCREGGRGRLSVALEGLGAVWSQVAAPCSPARSPPLSAAIHLLTLPCPLSCALPRTPTCCWPLGVVTQLSSPLSLACQLL